MYNLHLLTHLIQQLPRRLIIILQINLLLRRNRGHLLKQYPIQRANDGFEGCLEQSFGEQAKGGGGLVGLFREFED